MGRLEEGQAFGWLGEEEAGCAEKTLVYLCCESFEVSLKCAEQALPIRLTKMSQNGGTGIAPLVSSPTILAHIWPMKECASMSLWPARFQSFRSTFLTGDPL